MKKDNISLGLLRQRREQCGFSIDTVIQLLHERGIDISSKTLYGYENGVATPKVNTFIALCDIYGINDILGEFGLKNNIILATKDNEWGLDLYNEFFNASLLDKIYILLKNGVPSFSGYQDKLAECFPDDSTSANFSRLYSIFSSLDESKQGKAFFYLNEILNGRMPNLSTDELNIIALFRAASESDQAAIRMILSKYDTSAAPSRDAQTG